MAACYTTAMILLHKHHGIKLAEFARSIASTVALAAMSATTAAARDQISIVGSSTVFPYTQAVAEQFANTTGHPSPIVESTGTGGGMRIFCEGMCSILGRRARSAMAARRCIRWTGSTAVMPR